VPVYLSSPESWKNFWPLLVAALATSILLAILYQGRALFRARLLVVFSFAFLGIVAGFMAGLSRQPAVNAVMPAVLSLIAGLSIYLVGAKRADQGLIAICVIGLSADLMLGALWGAHARRASDEYYASDLRKEWEARVERKIRDYRRGLDLPDYPPSSKFKSDEGEKKD
jgi:hypothetical protein